MNNSYEPEPTAHRVGSLAVTGAILLCTYGIALLALSALYPDEPGGPGARMENIGRIALYAASAVIAVTGAALAVLFVTPGIFNRQWTLRLIVCAAVCYAGLSLSN